MRLSSLLILIIATALIFTAAFAREQQRLLRLTKTSTNENQLLAIETREVEPGLFSISVSPPYNYNNEKTVGQRRLRSSRKLEEHNTCTLVLKDVYYEVEDPKNSDETWTCVFENFVSADLGVQFPYTVDLAENENLGKLHELLEESEVFSNGHVLRWDFEFAVTLDEDNDILTLNVDPSEDGNILWIEEKQIVDDEGNEDTSQRKLQFATRTTGVKKTLAIRIVGDGIGPRSSLVQLRDEVFGSGISLKAQMERCSYGKLSIQPYSGRTVGGRFENSIAGGVVELRLPISPTGQNDKRMENEVMSTAWTVFGDLRMQFDLVLFAMPPGITPPFAAYAYIGTPFSFYSNDHIEDAMIQMHEVGHNLGLQHAGEGQEEYGDSSGYMGYSETKEPSMCYNAVNNYQLGWYSQYSVRPFSGDGNGSTFFISGVAGYDPNDSTRLVSLRLEQQTLPTDFYVGYNRAEEMNSQTQEDADKVIVFEKNGAVYQSSLSWKKASLHMGESYVIENFDNSGKSVTVTFSDINSDVAVVEISPERTESPTKSPTVAPTAIPTGSPTGSPTRSPTNSPSARPSITSGSISNSSSVDSENIICDNQLNLTINIRTDYFPEETYWKLKRKGGEVIYQINASYYDSRFHNYTHSFCLEFDNCYSFRIFDTMGDGMAYVGPNESSGYTLLLGNEQIIVDEGGWDRRKFHNKICMPSGGNETDSYFDFEDLLFGNETGCGNETGFGNETDFGNGTDCFDFYGNETFWGI